MGKGAAVVSKSNPTAGKNLRIRERPILFSGAMVRAILEGRKTQTRRVVSTRGFDPYVKSINDQGRIAPNVCDCYLKTGDRLWVRETWFDNCPGYGPENSELHYRADGMPDFEGEEKGIRWKPSIYMPRWASRITLEIVSVRVERLNDISAVDAELEGVAHTEFWTPKEMNDRPFEEKWWDDFHFWSHYPQIVFKRLWESIYGEGSWEANPWVWVVEFKVVNP